MELTDYAVSAGGLAFALLWLNAFRRVRRLSIEPPSTRQLAGGGQGAGGAGDWWHSPMASAAEAAVIASARAMVEPELGPLPTNADLQLLRQLRALGSGGTAAKLAATYSKMLRWRRSQRLPAAMPDAPRRELWPAPLEVAHGDWARDYVEIGIGCGRARGGHPVKIERAGKTDANGVIATPGGIEMLEAHYYGLLEAMMEAMDAESRASGTLLRTYEIFDMRGLSLRQLSFTSLKFARAIVTAIGSVYAETTVRAVLINLPRPVTVPINGILSLLPERLACRVVVLGEGQHYDFAGELDDEALRMLNADGHALRTHRGTPLPGANDCR